VKRAERERRERALEEHGRQEAERLALKALLDHRIPDSEHLVRAMKHPLLPGELAARGAGPTGVTYSSDVVRLYARVIAQRTGGAAQAVQQHFTQLIGKERAARLGINLGKLKVTSQAAEGGGTLVSVVFSDHDSVAVAGYLVSPDHLNLGDLPPNPFGNPRVADLMKQMKVLHDQSMIAHTTPYNGVGPAAGQFRSQAEELVDVVAYEISRAMPGNEAREAAIKAMRLTDCLETYTPQVVRQTGWQDIRVHDPDPVTGQLVTGTRNIAVYGVSPGELGSPTRYGHRLGKRYDLLCMLLNLYAG
jgi:hypothetical protein